MVEKKDKHEKPCDKKCGENSKHCEEKHQAHGQCEKQKADELDRKLNSLQESYEKLQKELEECKSKSAQYLSTAAYYKNEAETNKKDFERFKERNKQIESDAKIKAEEMVAKKLLPIIDNFDQAISQVDATVMRGFSMIYSSLVSVLSDLGVEEIVCKDSVLNPELHNCISAEPTDDKKLDGKIANVYQKGYKFAGTQKVIRPATVSVYKLS